MVRTIKKKLSKPTDSVRIYTDTHSVLLLRQGKRKQATGVKPFMADLIGELVEGSESTEFQKPKELTPEDENLNAIIQAVAALNSIIRSAEAAIETISSGRSSGTNTSSAGEDDELDAAVREVEAEAKKVRQAAKRTGGPGGTVRKRHA